MKNNNKGKAKSKTNANTLLPAVKLGGAVKIKWHYDEFKSEWYCFGSHLFEIHKDGNGYELISGGSYHIAWFKKLSSAQKVAELISKG